MSCCFIKSSLEYQHVTQRFTPYSFSYEYSSSICNKSKPYLSARNISINSRCDGTKDHQRQQQQHDESTTAIHSSRLWCSSGLVYHHHHHQTRHMYVCSQIDIICSHLQGLLPSHFLFIRLQPSQLLRNPSFFLRTAGPPPPLPPAVLLEGMEPVGIIASSAPSTPADSVSAID